MKQPNKNSATYIQELESKIVDLSLRLKGKDFKLTSVEKENHEHIKKLVHNLKNPIGVAYSFSEMIAENSEAISKEKLEKYIDVIKHSTDFSIEMLNAIAKLNRLKSPGFTLNLQKINYCEFLTNVLSEFNAEAINKNIVITTNFPSNVLYLNIDTEEMASLIVILMKNAIGYSSSNSKIHVVVTETDNTIETTITDQGIGISTSNLEAVFNEYFMVNTYSQDNNKCVGLGLTIAKIIVQQHKGGIKADSVLGKGSSFTCSFPKV